MFCRSTAPKHRRFALQRRRVASRTPQTGFTLMEIMLVVVIIAMLAAVIVPSLAGRDDQAKQSIVRTDMEGIASALQMYKLDNAHFPSTEQGLLALVEPPSGDPAAANWNPQGYLKKRKAPEDPWGNPYDYVFENGTFDIVSYGADGKPDGEGLDADIHYVDEPAS